MNNSLPLRKDFKKPDLLAPFKSVFFQFFEQLVDDCCMRIDLEFGLHFGKNREKMSKEHYHNLLAYLRSVRIDIKRNYLLKISENFEQIEGIKQNQIGEKIKTAVVTIASDDTVIESYASALIIRRCEQLYHDDLIRLNQLFAIILKKSAHTKHLNPVVPENLIKALVEVANLLKLCSNHRIALYKTFEANVFSQMGFIYLELIKHCESSIMKPAIETGDIEGNFELAGIFEESVNAEFQQLQACLSLWRANHTPSGYDPIAVESNDFYEHFEIKNALEVLEQFCSNSKIDPEAAKQPLKWLVIKRLEALDFSDDQKTLAKPDEDILDFVSLIFAGIADNAYLPDSVKATILRLKIPMSAACLGKYSIFINPANPIRQLLDELVTAGQLLNPNNQADCLVREQMDLIVNKLAKGNGFDISCWAGLAKEFAQFMTARREDSLLHEKQSIKTMIDREAQSAEYRAVADLIINNMKNKVLPLNISNFLQNAWLDVMLNAYLNKDRQPALWEKSIQTMNELIVSVTIPADDRERRHILNFIPGLINELRNGLKRISYSKEATSKFFKELVVLHIMVMDRKQMKTTEADAAKQITAPDIEIKIHAQSINDRFSHQVRAIKEGDWIAFELDTTRYWGKLARRSVNNENLLFVGKSGEKMLQITTDDLAELFRQGLAAPGQIDNLPVTVNVLANLRSLTSLAHHR